MTSERRGRGRKPSKSLTPGTFRPARPADTQGVLYLFAIAARAACVNPGQLGAITQTLGHACASLISPEFDAASECARMWQLFAKVAALPKDTLRLEAGRAFCRDLDALAQKLELPPLDEWVDIPQGIDEAAYEEDAAKVKDADAEAWTVPQAQSEARALLERYPGKKAVPPDQAAQLLARLGANERSLWLDTMVGQGALGRTDVSLLIRFLAKGGSVQAGDTMLVDVLDKLLRALQ